MVLEQSIKVLLNPCFALLDLSPSEGKIPSVTSQSSLRSPLRENKVYIAYWLAMLVFTSLSL